MRVLHGDCVEMMRTLPDNSVDAIVTDPPYELGFMGRKWDASGIAYSVEMWSEALRVLKPGGHLLAFGGTRTYHRMTVAIEDAGFEIRDCLQWLYGSGFPKSLDVSKAIDKAAGAERQVVGISPFADRGRVKAEGWGMGDSATETITAPATPEAEQWDGWGTALKPANEPIVLARKPLSEATVAANVLRWGTGAINVDACRIAGTPPSVPQPSFNSPTGAVYGFKTGEGRNGQMSHASGRWPANVILSHSLWCDDDGCHESCPVALLDAQSGNLAGRWGKGSGGRVKTTDVLSLGINDTHAPKTPNDSGGASRYFYVAKASRRERGEGNDHPTVKPIALMRYLIRLVTPPTGVVLDPFGGSGTTALAAMQEGVDAILIEREAEYVAIIEQRIAAALGNEVAA